MTALRRNIIVREGRFVQGFFQKLVDWCVAWICHKIVKAPIQRFLMRYPLSLPRLFVSILLSPRWPYMGLLRH